MSKDSDSVERAEKDFSPPDVSDLNRLWLPLAPFRLEIAKLVKEGNVEYPVGEIILIMRNILRREED